METTQEKDCQRPLSEIIPPLRNDLDRCVRTMKCLLKNLEAMSKKAQRAKWQDPARDTAMKNMTDIVNECGTTGIQSIEAIQEVLAKNVGQKNKAY